MTTTTAWLLAAWHSRAHRPIAPAPPSTPRLRADRGEGVISVAIAVLIMAFLGAAMWVGFQSMWQSTSEKTNTQVERIGEGP
jgi:uncharacterized protein HemX